MPTAGLNMFAMLKDLVMKNAMIIADKVSPANGFTGKGTCGRGALYIDTANGILYINSGDIKNPIWIKVGSQA